MPVIDGEKWACSSCIKGHRVSGCMHNDRELHHINPKGRPVKQCEHCRGARKSKSHHAKCDCGDRKDKDKPKDKGDAKGEHNGIAGASADEPSNHVADNEGRCCCISGAKCICGVKEALGLKLDTGKQTLHAARAKPKLTTTQSESTLTVFANGHHKPCHRNNNTAHVSGAPYRYKLGRPHTLHGSAAFATYAQGQSKGQADPAAPRALDTQSLSNPDYHMYLGSTQRSMDASAVAPLTGSLDMSGFQEPLFATQNTIFGQDSQSPTDSPLGDNFSAQQWPWTNNMAPATGNYGFGSLSTSPSQDCLTNFDAEWPMPSAGLGNPLWSAGDLPLDPTKLTDTLGNPPSNPGLTNGSSAHSEVGEPTLFGDVEFSQPAPSILGDLDYRPPQSAVSESLFWEDNPVFSVATSGVGEVPGAPPSVPAATTPPDGQGLEMDLCTGFGTSAGAMAGVDVSGKVGAVSAGSGPFSGCEGNETRAIAMPNSLDDIPSNDPWFADFDLGDMRSTFPFHHWP